MGWVTWESSLEALFSVSGIQHIHLSSEAYREPVCSGDDVLLSAGNKWRSNLEKKTKLIRCRKQECAVSITSASKSLLRQAYFLTVAAFHRSNMTVLCVCCSCTALCSESERWHDVDNFSRSCVSGFDHLHPDQKNWKLHLFISSLCSTVILFTITDQIQRIHILSYTESHAEVIKEYYLSTFYLMRMLQRKGFPAVLKSKVPQSKKPGFLITVI